MIVDLPLFGPVEMSGQAHAAYVGSMRKYYKALAPDRRPANWDDIEEVLAEREAIQRDAEDDYKNRRIFSRLPE